MSDNDTVHICTECESVFESDAELGGHCRVIHTNVIIKHVAVLRKNANQYMCAFRAAAREKSRMDWMRVDVN